MWEMRKMGESMKEKLYIDKVSGIFEDNIDVDWFCKDVRKSKSFDFFLSVTLFHLLTNNFVINLLKFIMDHVVLK